MHPGQPDKLATSRRDLRHRRAGDDVPLIAIIIFTRPLTPGENPDLYHRQRVAPILEPERASTTPRLDHGIDRPDQQLAACEGWVRWHGKGQT